MLQGTHSRETRDGAREVKFLATTDHAARVLDWAGSRLEADPNGGGPAGGQYRTTTIYFDTNDRAVYERRGSYGRSKYRIRRYGTSDVAFLERKLRTNRLLSKRRTAISVLDLPDLTAASEDAPARWFVDRIATRQLLPISQVSYRRHALVGTGLYGPMRLTFDDDIRAQVNGTTIFAPDGGTPILHGHVIIEMKFCIDTPGIMKELVERFALSPVPMSKYRTSIDALMAQLPAATGAGHATRPPLVAPGPSGLAGLAGA